MVDTNNDKIVAEKQKKLNYLNSLEYPIQLIEKKDKKFYLIIPELSLIVTDYDLGVAYKELCAKKEKLFKDVLECDAEETINLPQKIHLKKEIFKQLKVFFYKSLIICILGGMLFVFGIAEIKSSISSAINKFTFDEIRRGAVKELENFVNVPEDIRQKRLKKLQNILYGLEPFIDELQSTLKEPSGQKK